MAALKPIYTAVNAEVAREALDAFADGLWGRKYPAIAPAWRRQWEQVIPFFAYPPEVRRIIYTTNAIESLNSKLHTAVWGQKLEMINKPESRPPVNDNRSPACRQLLQRVGSAGAEATDDGICCLHHEGHLLGRGL